METKKLVPGNEYATCDGRLVVPFDPIQKGWYEYVQGEGRKKSTYIWHAATETDPWGGCMNARRPPDIGVRVTVYTADRDGKRIDNTGVETVVKPVDIKGLWVDFLVLYGERVRAQADEREERKTLDRLDKTVASLAVPGVDGLSFDIQWHYGSQPGGAMRSQPYLGGIAVHGRLTPDELGQLLSLLRIADKTLLTELTERYRTQDQWRAIQTAKRQKRSA